MCNPLQATIGAALRYQTLRSLTATEIGAEPQGMLRNISSSLIIQVRVILMPPGYPDPAAGQRIDKKGAFNSRMCIQTVSAAAALMSSLVSKGAMLVRLQHEAYMTYDCGKYVESLRIAEEIYAIDAVNKKSFDISRVAFLRYTGSIRQPASAGSHQFPIAKLF